MLTPLSPAGIRAPFARYSHGIMAPPGFSLVAISGQLGVDADDSAPDTAEAQAELCFGNIEAILSDGGLSRVNVMRINAYVTDRAHMQGYMRARDLWIADLTPAPASTLMIVAGFTRPEFKVEIEALAAAPP